MNRLFRWIGKTLGFLLWIVLFIELGGGSMLIAYLSVRVGLQHEYRLFLIGLVLSAVLLAALYAMVEEFRQERRMRELRT